MRLVLTGPLIRRRLALCMAAFLLLFVALSARLAYLQMVSSADLQRRAQAQWTSESVISSSRGEITDRNGNVLAISATAYTASVNPRQVADVQALSEILSPILGIDASEITKKASDTSKSSVILKRQLTREIAQQLKTMLAEHKAAGSNALDGLVLDEDSQRFYPYGAFASQLIGITTIDGIGQAGIEESLNDYLSGKSGKVLGEIDGKGRALAYGESEYVAPVDGSDVRLTIDATIQGFCEKAAREAIEVNKAEGIRILVMNPKTGEILAMVVKPDFDLNDPPRDDVDLLNELMRNRAVTDAYEPGSTFKIVTISSALDAGLTNVNEGFYCSGSLHVEGGKISCWGNPHGAETLTQALGNSCNPVFAELGMRLGSDTFYKYLNAYGIGTQTGIDISGEASGIVIAQFAVKRGDLARMGFGQSIAVTPLQLLTAACATVNGGYLLKPYVVKEITSPDGEVIERGERTVVSQPISEKTSKTMRSLLTYVVEKGGGKNARIEGYTVGGKTGTAQVYIDGQVSHDVHIGSFIGIAPMEDPAIAFMVVVDKAAVGVDFGAVTALPYAKSIIEQSLVYLGYPKNEGAEAKEEVEVPNVTGMTVPDAIEALKAVGLDYVLDGSGAYVENQLPAAGAGMTEGSLVMLYVKGATLDAEYVNVPDVTGLSVAEANRLIRSYGLIMTISGSGLAVSQAPAAGEAVVPTTSVTVQFDPP
jgi:stage V sporulation protein D (sporulation-specific penicillin-binding protein)